MTFSGGMSNWVMIFNLWGVTIQPGMGGPLWGNDAAGSAGIFHLSPDVGGVDIRTFDADPGQDAGVYKSSAVDFSTATTGIGVFLVRPIPEPSTALLLGFGLAGLAAGRRRG